jgi:hypothetical protein
MATADGFVGKKRFMRQTVGAWPRVEIVLTVATGEVSGVVSSGRGAPQANAQVSTDSGGHRVVGRTDGVGRFLLKGIGPAPLVLLVQQPQFAPLRRRVERSGEYLSLTLRRLGRVQGTVSEWRVGSPINRFDVMLEGRTRSIHSAHGQYAVDLEPGRRRVAFGAPGFAWTALVVDVADPESGGLPARLDVSLKPAGSVSGRILRANGEGVANAVVSVGDLHTRTDGRGRFTLEGVPIGAQLVSVRGVSATVHHLGPVLLDPLRPVKMDFYLPSP